MLKLRAFSVFDSKLSVFMTPFFFSRLGEATRAWEDLCNDPKSSISKYPSDFILYEIGEFDTDKAELSSHNPIRIVQTAVEVIRKPQDQLPFRDSN